MRSSDRCVAGETRGVELVAPLLSLSHAGLTIFLFSLSLSHTRMCALSLPYSLFLPPLPFAAIAPPSCFFRFFPSAERSARFGHPRADHQRIKALGRKPALHVWHAPKGGSRRLPLLSRARSPRPPARPVVRGFGQGAIVAARASVCGALRRAFRPLFLSFRVIPSQTSPALAPSNRRILSRNCLRKSALATPALGSRAMMPPF